MSRYCCVPLCYNRSQDNVSLHRFPKDATNRYDVWIARLGRIDLFLKPKKVVYCGYRVCGEHFSKEQRNGYTFKTTTPLLKNAVPDLNLPYEYCKFLPFVVEMDHNYTSVIIDEVPRSAITYQNVLSQPMLENMLICDEDFLNIKSTHICLFCMKVLDKTNEFNIQSNVTKEGIIFEAFIKASLLYMSLDEHLESYFLCLNCLDMINELEGYFIKCKNIQECLVKQYAEHKQSKEKKNYSIDEDLLTLNAVEDGRQTIDLAIQCNTKDYATRETQTYNFSTQLEDESILRGSLSKLDENEMNVEMNTVDENINRSERQSILKKKKIKIDPHSSSGYCCDKCGKVFWKCKAFRNHELWHRNENKFRCEICNKTFSQQSKLTQHSSIHSGVRPHECETCGKTFRLAASLKFHSMSMHPIATTSSGFCCEKCGMTYLSYYGFKEHIKKHRFENKFRCKICDKSLSCPSSLRKHNIIHEGIRSFECNECGKKFCNRHLFIAHKASHSDVRNYQCHICEKAFKTMTNLTQHVKKHLKPYQCLECGKTFSEKFILTNHMKDHPTEDINGPRDCELCGKKCMNLRGLKLHMLVHRKKRTFQCERCEKTFSFKHNLTMHMKVHAQDKPHPCSICGKGFAQYINLMKHIDIHHSTEGLHQYDCKICGKKCGNSNYFKVHMGAHNGNRNYKCNICDRAFVFKHSLTNHMKVHLQENLQV